MQQAYGSNTDILGGIALILTIALLSAIALTMIGVDITPAISWPTTYVPGAGGDPTYLPPAR